MLLKIETKKIVVDGKKCRKVKKIDSLYIDDVPTDYLKVYPNCFMVDEGVFIVMSDKNMAHEIVEGYTYPESYFQKILDLLGKCGDNLHNVNQKIKELKKGWNGAEIFEW